MTGLMAGKRGLIMGLANEKSLAWGIAQRLSEQGAELNAALAETPEESDMIGQADDRARAAQGK